LKKGTPTVFNVEYWDPVIQLFCADEPSTHEGVLAVALVPRPASCKPRDRWLAARSAEEAQCCGHSIGNGCCE